MSVPPKKRKLAEIVRSRKLEDIPLDLIADEDGRTNDDHFTKLYRQYCFGKRPSVLTRVNIDKIWPGVFKRSSEGEVVQFDSEVSSKFVEWMSYEIRCGFRPVLYLYKGIFGDTASGFVCADDVAAYQAYRSLGIRRLPAVILGKHVNMLTESGICLRIKDGRTAFDSTIAIPRPEVQSFFGEGNELRKLSPFEALTKLKEATQKAAVCIKAFHIEEKSEKEIHYHHCLHSVAFRLLETLNAVELLLKNNMAYQIRPLVRSAYDLFLNFYIDWLSPEHVGMLLQSLAVLSRTQKTDSQHLELKRAVEAAYGGLADVCRNMYEKGRLSPLGARGHSMIYSNLSPAVHQDFGVAHEYGDTLVAGRVEETSDEDILANIRWLDLIAAGTITRLLDDVGAADGELRQWPDLERSPVRYVGMRRPSLPSQGQRPP
jgi:hypothetical protein